MFDIGFLELLLIGVVGLLVIGPDRLPETARTLALWLGRARRMVSRFRSDIEQEIGADEIRTQLRNEAIMEQLRETQTDLEHSVDDLKQDISATETDAADTLAETAKEQPAKAKPDTSTSTMADIDNSDKP